MIAGDAGIEPLSSRSGHTSYFKITTLVATLQSAWCCKVSARVGLPGVRILKHVRLLKTIRPRDTHCVWSGC